ncbi:hypothetical protein [Pseudazoarcus pumilus]|uniref:N-acetyltransferase n=1 Tax=Pseudazoarcus pumilus TaxID=2067960 RepID=A0A2I6S4G0_9RHOO|nr:hypothetical protein [Pseudazoarcus pumilus]AUN94141.1 hypothetical protein C0099_03800 [Pseudazoarcus pumilus]
MKKRGEAKLVWFAVQTVLFVRQARRAGGVYQRELKYADAAVSVEYTAQTDLREGSAVRGMIRVCVSAAPPHRRRQRWLHAYLKLCETLADDIMIVTLPPCPVREKLLKRGYVEVSKHSLMLDLRAA